MGFYRGRVGADVNIGPTELLVGADDPVRPGPITQRLVGQGPCALPWSAGKIRFGPSGKSAKRCQWQMKRAGFEEVPRLADTTVTGNRLARRWATAGPYESVSCGA